ncbi:hypothetical protein [Paenibacillus sp. FSL K6-2859]
MNNDSMKFTDEICCQNDKTKHDINIKNDQTCCNEPEDKGCCPADEN